MEYTLIIENDIVKTYKKTKNSVVQTTVKTIFWELTNWKYTLSIKRHLQKRTVNQNRYYWACLGLIAIEVGYLIEEMDSDTKKNVVEGLHEIFKNRFIPNVSIVSIKDRRRKISIPKTTTNMDTGEFKRYMDKIRELHPYLPNPESTWESDLLAFVDRFYFL